MLGLGNLLTKSGVIKKFPNDFSFNFDGSNDNLVLDNESGKLLLNNGASGSISVWVYAETLNQTNHDGTDWRYPTIISKSNVHLSLIVDKDGAVLGFYNDGSAVYNIKTADSIVSTGSWHHIAWTWNASTSKLYVNGTERYSGSYTPYNMASGGNNTDVYIGQNASSNSGNYAKWDGLIDEIAVWRDAELSASDVAKIASKPVDLSKASKYATDRTSNLKLWLRAGDKAEPESTTAIARQDFYTDFSASDDYIDLNTDFESWIESPNRSFTTWVKNGGNTDEVRIFNVGYASGATGFALGLDGGFADNIPFYFLRNTSAGVLKASFGDVLNTTDWYHFAITINDSANEAYLYQNGILKATVSNVGTPSQTTDTSAKIGGFWGNGLTNNFNGQISNMALYQTTLDAQTISQMAKSRFTPMRDNRFSVVDFDGSNDYIATNANTGLSDATYTFWAKSTVEEKNLGVFGHGSTTTSGFHIWASDSAYFQLGDSFYRFFSFTDNLINDGVFHHFAIVADTSDISACKLYIDGVETTTSTTVTTGSATSRSGLEIGRSSSADEWEGSISQFAVYSELKDSEFISAQYQKGILADYSNDTNLSAYYRMGDDTSKAYPTIADSSSNSNDGTITNGASDDIVQQMVAGYDLGAFESSSEELGGEIVTNGTFDSDISNWTDFDSARGDASWSNGRLRIDNTTGTGNYYIKQTASFESGKLYKIQFDHFLISGTETQGNFYFDASDQFDLSKSTHKVGDTYTLYASPSANRSYFIIGDGDFGDIFELDNITIKEVLQSEVSDTYPAIIDVNEPVLGVEVVGDPSFDTGGSANISISNTTDTQVTGGALVYTDGSASDVTFLKSSANILTSGDLYKLVFTIADAGGSGARIAFSFMPTSVPNYDHTNYLNGTHTIYFNADQTNALMNISAASPSFKMTDVSIKKILGNVGLMTNQDSADLVYSSVLPDQSFLTGVNSAYNFLDFDGTDAYVSVSAINDNYKSISFWFNLGSNATSSTIYTTFGAIGSFQGSGSFITIGGGATSSVTNELITLGASGVITAWESDSDTITGNVWHHLAIVWNGSKYVFYYDGELKDTTSGTASHVSLQSNNSILIGRNAGGSSYYKDNLTSYSVFNKSLSASEVSAIYTAGRHTNLLDSYSDNLLLFLAFGALDAVTGLSDTDSTIYDRSGNSNHGTTSGTATGDLKSPPNAEPNGYAKGDTNRSTTTP